VRPEKWGRGEQEKLGKARSARNYKKGWGALKTHKSGVKTTLAGACRKAKNRKDDVKERFPLKVLANLGAAYVLRTGKRFKGGGT